MMAPNWVLAFLRRRYGQGAATRGLPDAMDMLVVCAEAGLGLDSAVERVAREMAGSNQAVSSEFALLAHELRVMPDRRQALDRLGERALVELLKRLAATLGQTFRFGTPLAQALRVLAAEARQERVLPPGEQGGAAAGADGDADDPFHHALLVHRPGRAVGRFPWRIHFGG